MKTFSSSYTGGPKIITNLGFSNKSKKGNQTKPKIEHLIFEGIVNEKGIAIFENIPRTVCSIDVSENEFFKESNKYISLPTEVEKDDIIQIYLPVERQDTYTTTVYMVKGKDAQTDPKGKNNEENPDNYYENLSLRAVLLEIFEESSENGSESSKNSDYGSEIEYEEEFEEIEDRNGKKLLIILCRNTML